MIEVRLTYYVNLQVGSGLLVTTMGIFSGM